jgi:hypothetical protein
MTSRFIVQASGAFFMVVEVPETNFVEGACVFGIFVTDEEGTPVESLTKENFSVWNLTSSPEETKTYEVMELNTSFPVSHMPGIYRLQTEGVIPAQAPSPHQFVYAICVAQMNVKMPRQGMTTVPITWLGSY